jgi:peroxiredoxin
MRSLLFMTLSAALMLMVACTQKSENAYTVTGTADGTQDGDTVFICEMQGYFNMVPTDTTIIKDGKFTFNGEFEGAALRWLMPIHEGEPTTLAMFVLEKGEIKATLIKGEGESEIEGGPNGKIYDEFMEGSNKIGQQMDAPWRISTDSTKTEEERQVAEAKLDSLNKVMMAYQKKFIIDHIPSAASDMLYGFCSFGFSEEEQEEILKLFGEKQPNFPVYKSIMAERKANESTAIGHIYTDMKMDDPNGKSIKLSDFVGKNKYVLIDFWASWCGPCREEMPTVVEAYTKFHSKGFEVVGVSLDENKEAWVKATSDLQMPWPQMSDLKGWESKACETYHVQAIPANVLVDEKGKIIGKDLRGEDLLNKMKELLP